MTKPPLVSRTDGELLQEGDLNDHVQKGVLVWAQKVKMRKGLKGALSKSDSAKNNNADPAGPSVKIEMAKAGEDAKVVGNTE